jgi:hypothetical protein
VADGARTVEWGHTSRTMRWAAGLTEEVDPHRGGGGSGGWRRSIDGGGDRWSKAVREVSCDTVEEGKCERWLKSKRGGPRVKLTEGRQ